MKDYEALKAMWQNTPGAALPSRGSSVATTRQKLQQQLLLGAACLLLTVLAIGIMALAGLFPFHYWYTYAALLMITMICLLQAVLLGLTCLRLKRIDDTATPARHLEQWKDYYHFRQKQLAWNLPSYFLSLNIAFGIYFIETMGNMSLQLVIGCLAIYGGWMCFAWFYLGKKSLRKEQSRLKNILEELEEKEHSFRESEPA